MRFLELLNGDLLNIECIKKVGYECVTTNKGEEDQTEKLYSYIYDFEGNKYDFLDYPENFFFTEDDEVEETNEIIFDGEHANFLNYLALSYILAHEDDSVISIDEVDELAWVKFEEIVKQRQDREKSLLKTLAMREHEKAT